MVGNDPKGDKWTYDDENRKKYPKSKTPPTIEYPKENKEFCEEGINYVNTHFSENYGILNSTISYPTDSTSAKDWFNDFLKKIFEFKITKMQLLRKKQFSITLLSPY